MARMAFPECDLSINPKWLCDTLRPLLYTNEGELGRSVAAWADAIARSHANGFELPGISIWDEIHHKCLSVDTLFKLTYDDFGYKIPPKNGGIALNSS